MVPLDQGETTVGRSNRSTIHLPDPDLAEIHFVIRQKSRGWQLRDKGSGLGTKVNGKPVFATTLTDGDVIDAGGLRCVFLVRADKPGPAARTPAAASPARRATPAPPRRSRPEPAPQQKSPVGLFVGIGVGVVAIIAVLLLLFKGQAAEDEARELWRDAKRFEKLSRAESGEAPSSAEAEEHLKKWAEALRTLRADYGDTRLARAAGGALREAEDTLRAMDALRAEERRLGRDLTEVEAEDAFQRIGRAARVVHPAVAARAARVEVLVKQLLTASLERRFDAARAKADEFAANEEFGRALRTLAEFGRQVPRAADRVRGAEAKLGKRIANRFRAVLRAAGRGKDLDARIELLEAHREAFSGTRYADDLEVRVSVLRARRNARAIVVVRPPTSDDPKTPDGAGTGDGPNAEPATAGPYEDPPRVVELAKARRYAEAAQVLNGISRHPDAKTRVGELTLMATLFADLAAAIKDRPAEFAGVLLPDRGGRADAVTADGTGITVKTKDGVAKLVSWSRLPAKGFAKFFRQAGFLKPPRLGTAIFLDEEGLAGDATRAYIAFHRAEQDREKLNRILARRRGIDMPPQGFVVFRNALVAPADKDRTLLLERIDKIGRKARTTSQEKLRRAAWADLKQLGEIARETLIAVLLLRRAQVADELHKSRAFKPSRYARKFGPQLTSRRGAALAFILDARKYPYPNKSDAAQAEAERLVKLVRDLYETPYARLLEASEPAQVLDAELRELDGRLAKEDPLSTPLHEEMLDKIEGGLDVAWIPIDDRDKKRHDYNRKVLAYNRSVKTSADSEERSNVLAVNEYRHMMGLVMVKIDERLVRAARKHSIEMVQLNYFAHDSRTPHLRSPSHRARREGYPSGVAENIARGASTGRGAFQQWYKSSGHHRNMLRPGHRELGCGACKHHWWTQKFGRATGNKLSPPTVPQDPDPPGESGNGMPPPK